MRLQPGDRDDEGVLPVHATLPVVSSSAPETHKKNQDVTPGYGSLHVTISVKLFNYKQNYVESEAKGIFISNIPRQPVSTCPK